MFAFNQVLINDIKLNLMNFKAFYLLLVLMNFSNIQLLVGQTCTPGDPGYVNIDFETDGFGNPLELGEVIDENTYSNLGIELSVSNVPGINPLVIFDTSNPTGGDCDLGTPGFNCPDNTTDNTAVSYTHLTLPTTPYV